EKVDCTLGADVAGFEGGMDGSAVDASPGSVLPKGRNHGAHDDGPLFGVLFEEALAEVGVVTLVSLVSRLHQLLVFSCVRIARFVAIDSFRVSYERGKDVSTK